MKPEIGNGFFGNSQFYIFSPSSFALANYFYTQRCGHYYVEKQYMISRQKPAFTRYLLMYVISGSMVIVTNVTESFVHAHEIILIDTNKPHVYAAVEKTEFIWLHFDGSCSNALVEKILQFGTVFALQNNIKVMRILHSIVNGFSSEVILPEEQISASIGQILADILTEQHKGQKVRDFSMETVATYLQTHYDQPVTLTDLAKVACLNASYLALKFNREIGCTPRQYLLQIRMNAARILLRDTDWPINQIADKTGFQSNSYFSSCFHKLYGISPIQFREDVES